MENHEPKRSSMKDAFVTCGCAASTCPKHGGKRDRLGAMWATALTGFVAGVAVASIVFLPWLIIEARMSDYDKVPPTAILDEEEYDAMIGNEPAPDDAMTADPDEDPAMPADDGTQN